VAGSEKRWRGSDGSRGLPREKNRTDRSKAEKWAMIGILKVKVVIAHGERREYDKLLDHSFSS